MALYQLTREQTVDSGLIISRGQGGACLERCNNAAGKVTQKLDSKVQLTYKGEEPQPEVHRCQNLKTHVKHLTATCRPSAGCR
jgi:hypothetical protein